MYLVWLDGIDLDAMRFKGTTNMVTWTGKLDREVQMLLRMKGQVRLVFSATE